MSEGPLADARGSELGPAPSRNRQGADLLWIS